METKLGLGKIWGKIKEGVLGAVFPARCVGCGREGRYVCSACEVLLGEASFVCPSCSQASFGGERHAACRQGLDGLVSVWEYEGLVQRLIHLMKYEWASHAAGEIMERSFSRMLIEHRRFTPFLSYLRAPGTVIAYVPMHTKKERRRGFNQAEIFAKLLAEFAHARAVSMLRKIGETKSQAQSGKEERFENVKNSFEISDKFPVESIKRTVIVDDVWTTGATMQECTRVLKKAGVREVWGFTVARTP